MHVAGPSPLRENKDQKSDLTFATVARVANGTPRPMTLILVPQPFEPQGNMEVPAVSLGPDASMQAPILLCCGPGTFQGPVVK